QVYVAIARPAYQFEHFGESWYSGPGNRELVGKPSRVLTAWSNLSDIVLLDFRERQFDEGNARRRHVEPIGSARKVRIETPLVRHDYHPILGDPHVEFKRIHAHRQGVGEGLQRVFGAQ